MTMTMTMMIAAVVAVGTQLGRTPVRRLETNR